jgi:hypothetical protein
MLAYYIFMIVLYFIYYCYLSSRIGHDFVHVQFYLNKDRSFVMLTSSVRLCSVLHFEAPEWFLVRWQIASCSYMSSHLAFLAVNMELSGTPGKFQALEFNYFVFC